MCSQQLLSLIKLDSYIFLIHVVIFNRKSYYPPTHPPPTPPSHTHTHTPPSGKGPLFQMGWIFGSPLRRKKQNRSRQSFSILRPSLFEVAIYDIYKLNEELQGNVRKLSKLTYKTIYPGNSNKDVSLALEMLDETITAAIKQLIKSYYPNRSESGSSLELFHKDVSLALEMFDETITAAIKQLIKSYCPNRSKSASSLDLFHKVFVIFNSKQQFHTSNFLQNTAIPGDNGPLSVFLILLSFGLTCGLFFLPLLSLGKHHMHSLPL